MSSKLAILSSITIILLTVSYYKIFPLLSNKPFYAIIKILRGNLKENLKEWLFFYNFNLQKLTDYIGGLPIIIGRLIGHFFRR